RGPGAGTRGALAWAVPAVLSLATAPGARAADAVPPAYPAGFSSFQADCAVCHGPAGAGLPALAPPLLSYPARYAASVEGRRQLAFTVLYGMVGDISVEDKHYNFQMPGFARLDDATLVATLNFVAFDLGHAPARRARARARTTCSIAWAVTAPKPRACPAGSHRSPGRSRVSCAPAKDATTCCACPARPTRCCRTGVSPRFSTGSPSATAPPTSRALRRSPRKK